MLNDTRGTREAGFTLVELLVVIVILGVIGGMVTSTVIASLNATRRAEARMTALSDLQRGVERVGRELRAADPLVLDSENDYAMSVGADVSRAGERITYRYYIVEPADGNPELREDVVRSTLGGDLIEQRDGLFIADIANIETEVPLFTYFAIDDEGELSEIDCEDLSDSACRDKHLTASQIRLSLEKLLPEQDPVYVETMVNIRNTRYATSED